MENLTFDFGKLSNLLPPLIWRSRWNDYRNIGLPYSRGSMQNFDCEGKGPKKVMFGKRVGYEREELILWLNAKSDESRDA